MFSTPIFPDQTHVVRRPGSQFSLVRITVEGYKNLTRLSGMRIGRFSFKSEATWMAVLALVGLIAAIFTLVPRLIR